MSSIKINLKDTNKGYKEMNINWLKTISIFLFFSFTTMIIWLTAFYKSPVPAKIEPTSNSEEQKLKLDENMNGSGTITLRKSGDGRKLFKANCSMCHHLSDEMSTGPGLKGVSKLVPGKEWTVKFIKNNIQMLKDGDPYAIKFRRMFNGLMTVYEGVLTDEEIRAIVDYIFPEPGETMTSPVSMPSGK